MVEYPNLLETSETTGAGVAAEFPLPMEEGMAEVAVGFPLPLKEGMGEVAVEFSLPLKEEAGVVEYPDPLKEEVVVAALMFCLGVAVVGDHNLEVEGDKNPIDVWDDLGEDLLAA